MMSEALGNGGPGSALNSDGLKRNTIIYSRAEATQDQLNQLIKYNFINQLDSMEYINLNRHFLVFIQQMKNALGEVRNEALEVGRHFPGQVRKAPHEIRPTQRHQRKQSSLILSLWNDPIQLEML